MTLLSRIVLVCVPWCVFLLTMNVPAEMSMSSKYTIKWQNCRDLEPFRTLMNIPLDDCEKECHHRKACAAVNYWHKRLKCEMLSTDDVTSSDLTSSAQTNGGNGNKSCAFIPMPSIRKYSPDIVGGCNSCSDREVCVKGSSSCVIKECRRLRINHGKVKGNMLDIGSKVAIVCDEWYRLEPDTSKSVCQANGNWSNVPECVIDTGCGDAPDMPNAVMKAYRRMANNSVYAVYNCSSGYNVPSLNGILYVECRNNGSWAENDTQCLIECGPLPTFADAKVTTGNSLEGDLRSYNCTNDLFLVGLGSTTCTYNGTWTEVNFKCVTTPCLHSFPLAWGDSCYKATGSSMRIEDAMSYCQTKYNGSHLLQIETEEEYKYVRYNYPVEHGAVCLGLRKHESTWIWQGTNTTLGYNAWGHHDNHDEWSKSYAVMVCQMRFSWWRLRWVCWWDVADSRELCTPVCELSLSSDLICNMLHVADHLDKSIGNIQPDSPLDIILMMHRNMDFLDELDCKKSLLKLSDKSCPTSREYEKLSLQHSKTSIIFS